MLKFALVNLRKISVNFFRVKNDSVNKDIFVISLSSVLIVLLSRIYMCIFFLIKNRSDMMKNNWDRLLRRFVGNISNKNGTRSMYTYFY